MNMLILGLSVRRPEVENVSYGVTVYHINTHIQLELAAAAGTVTNASANPREALIYRVQAQLWWYGIVWFDV